MFDSQNLVSQASMHVIAYELDSTTKRAKELWRLKVKLHGDSGTASEFYKKAKENKCLTCDWPATVAVNAKYLLVQSEQLTLYKISDPRKQPGPGTMIQLDKSNKLCSEVRVTKEKKAYVRYDPTNGKPSPGGVKEVLVSCGQIAVGSVQEHVAFSLTGRGEIFKINLQDTNSKPELLVNLRCLTHSFCKRF